MFSPEEHHISMELFHITIYASGSAQMPKSSLRWERKALDDAFMLTADLHDRSGGSWQRCCLEFWCLLIEFSKYKCIRSMVLQCPS
jgi:hypothetical protein